MKITVDTGARNDLLTQCIHVYPCVHIDSTKRQIIEETRQKLAG